MYNMQQFDVTIVGGGPVGCFIANQLAQKNINTAIFEEHQHIGRPLHCAGLVTDRVFHHLNIEPENIIQNTIHGAHIHAPDDTVLSIGGDKIHALVINRSKFDAVLSSTAEHNNAQLFLNHKVKNIVTTNNSVKLKVESGGKEKQFFSSILIGADGPRSLVRKTFQFPEPSEFLYGIGAEVCDVDMDSRFVELFLGKRISPGFFAWAIPINKKGTAGRIGLCVPAKNKNELQTCFSYLKKKLEIQDNQITQSIGGIIPLGPLRQTVKERCLLVGDAAAQVKPTSGGGIYPGLVSGRHCSAVVESFFKNSSVNQKKLEQYHRLWFRDIGRELRLGMKFRKVFLKLDDKQLNTLLEKFSQNKIVDVINTYGDIDHPSKLAFPLIKVMPSLLKFLPSAL